ncbi:MAG: energy transducer TonB [Deltaproteobacteria bacterium]|nr:energy transducer TonB [Candidatus Anaeroferrophillus wilburensis]MBN2889839.1 energy transducer TonB [Deltaproteobacteria bacterium]
MSCKHGTRRRLPSGIVGAVLINLVLLASIPLFFHQRSLPKQVTQLRPVPVWQVEHQPREEERLKEEKPEPIKKMVKLPPLPLPPVPRLTAQPTPVLDLPLPPLAVAPTDLGTVAVAPMERPLKGLYRTAELDQQPLPLATPAPLYPVAARRRGIEGEVQVRFLVDSQGFVKDVRIVSAEPSGYFEKAVASTLSRWRFQPGVVSGSSVNSEVETTIVFKLDK